MELNKIHNIDCLEFMKSMPDNCVDLVVTDPPYEIAMGGGGILKKDRVYFGGQLDKIANGFDVETTLNEIERICKKVNIFMFCSNKQISKIMSWAEKKEYSPTCLVWYKPNAIPFTNNTFKSDLEYCIHIRESGVRLGGESKIKSKLSTHNSRKSQYGHPTEKPLVLIKKYILIGSKENELVFDPFMGSGTTAVACKELNRNFIGCEIEPKYCEIAEKRLRETIRGLL